MSLCLAAGNAVASASATLDRLPTRFGHNCAGSLRHRAREDGNRSCVCPVSKGNFGESHKESKDFTEAQATLKQAAFKQPEEAMTVVSKESSPNAKAKLHTLVIIEQDGRLLLGMKKRGYGEGYYNGFGGKVEAGETIEEAAARELEEEAGIVAVDMVKRGVLTFHNCDMPPFEVHVFHVQEFAGEPCETEEMSPMWFPIAEIPYDQMWKDDMIWFPLFLKGDCFRGEFFFKTTKESLTHTLTIVPVL